MHNVCRIMRVGRPNRRQTEAIAKEKSEMQTRIKQQWCEQRSKGGYCLDQFFTGNKNMSSPQTLILGGTATPNQGYGISPSLTSFVQFLDSAEAVYSTSSASESINCRHPTSLMSTARHGLKDCITDRPQLRKPCEGYERTISVATHRRGGRLRQTVDA